MNDFVELNDGDEIVERKDPEKEIAAYRAGIETVGGASPKQYALQVTAASTTPALIGYTDGGGDRFAYITIRQDGAAAFVTSQKLLTGSANPNITAPISSPLEGYQYLQTSDGTATGTPQATWVFAGTQWVQINGFPTVLTASSATRTYHTATTALQEKWPAQPTAGQITGWGFTPVGTGTLVPYSGLWNSYGMLTGNVPRPTYANEFTPPTSYIRHEVAIAPGVENKYFLQVIQEVAGRDHAMTVWVCDPVTGVPVIRIAGMCTTCYDLGTGSQTYLRSPQNTSGVLDSFREWFGFAIPKTVIASYRTGTNTIKLAILPNAAAGGSQNGSPNVFYLTGFAMADNPYSMNWNPAINLGNAANEITNNNTNGGNAITNWQVTEGMYNSYATLGQARIIRIPIADATRDIYLSFAGMVRPGDGYDYALGCCEFAIKHASGDVPLGRPLMDVRAPSSLFITNGHKTSGWLIPAATLAAKVTAVTNSISYLRIEIAPPVTMVSNAHITGIMTEAV